MPRVQQADTSYLTDGLEQNNKKQASKKERNSLPVSLLKTAGFRNVGSGLYMFMGSNNLPSIRKGSLWSIKEADGEKELVREEETSDEHTALKYMEENDKAKEASLNKEAKNFSGTWVYTEDGTIYKLKKNDNGTYHVDAPGAEQDNTDVEESDLQDLFDQGSLKKQSSFKKKSGWYGDWVEFEGKQYAIEEAKEKDGTYYFEHPQDGRCIFDSNTGDIFDEEFEHIGKGRFIPASEINGSLKKKAMKLSPNERSDYSSLDDDFQLFLQSKGIEADKWQDLSNDIQDQLVSEFNETTGSNKQASFNKRADDGKSGLKVGDTFKDTIDEKGPTISITSISDNSVECDNGESYSIEEFIQDISDGRLEKKQASKKTAGEEPKIENIPESVELDTVNKYNEQSKQRELSESEKADTSLLSEDLSEKGLLFE